MELGDPTVRRKAWPLPSPSQIASEEEAVTMA